MAGPSTSLYKSEDGAEILGQGEDILMDWVGVMKWIKPVKFGLRRIQGVDALGLEK